MEKFLKYIIYIFLYIIIASIAIVVVIWNIFYTIILLVLYIGVKIKLQYENTLLYIGYLKKVMMFKKNFLLQKILPKYIFRIIKITIIFILVNCIIASEIPFKLNAIQNQDLTSIISIIGMICGGLWAIYQFINQQKRTQQEKAAIFIDDFSKELSGRLDIISAVLLLNDDFKVKIEEFKKNFDEPKRFDEFEIQEKFNYDDESLKKYFEEIQSIIFSKDVQKTYKKEIKKRYGANQNIFPCSFKILLESTLERIEYLCMFIVSNTEGSDFVYNSFHQRFLYVVNLLQIYISDGNNNNYDKRYVNIIEVFNSWTLKRMKFRIRACLIGEEIKGVENWFSQHPLKKYLIRRLKLKKVCMKKIETII